MALFNYTEESIRLPSNPRALFLSHLFSVTGGKLVLLCAVLMLIDSLLNLGILPSFFGKTYMDLFTIVSLCFAGLGIFILEARDKNKQLSNTLALFIIGFFLTSLSLVIIAYLFRTSPNITARSVFYDANLGACFIFLLVGLAFLVKISKIPHKHHLLQGLLFFSLALSLFGAYEELYKIISFEKIAPKNIGSLFTSVVFAILSQSLICSIPNRGFMGLFTSETHSSQLARRALFLVLVLLPFLGILILIGARIGIIDLYAKLSLLVVFLIIFSTLSVWINIKLLRASEVENYLMKQAMKQNNITLAQSGRDLSAKVSELERSNKEVEEKLNNEEALKDIVQTSS